MAHDVFLSYSQKDKATADAVCRALEKNSVRVWMAPRDIQAGANWSEAIPKAIIDARALVLVFSAGANASTYIPRELELAADQKKPIIPIRLANVAPTGSVRFFISTSQWLDAFPPPLDSHLTNLVQMTRKSLGMRSQNVVSGANPAPKTDTSKPGTAPARTDETRPRENTRFKLVGVVAGVAVVMAVVVSVILMTSHTIATSGLVSASTNRTDCGGSDCSGGFASDEPLPGLDQPEGFFKVLRVDTLEVDGHTIHLAGVGRIISDRVSSLDSWMRNRGNTVLCEQEQPFHGRYDCNVGNDHSSVSDYVIKRGWAEPIQNTSAQN